MLISSERLERIAHGHSFLVSDLSGLLTSLIFGERPERFAHGCSFHREVSLVKYKAASKETLCSLVSYMAASIELHSTSAQLNFYTLLLSNFLLV